MENCLFCKIANGEIPSKKAYEDDTVLAFYDIEPQAPVHVLIVPKKHYTSVMDIESADQALLSHMIEIAQKLAKELGVSKDGFRLVINTGENGGQSVPQLHIHLLGGRKFGWPAG
ncbi:MAG: histidine triad nucleotide-binding protein [Eubacteriales bacterium]|nr:histidine triad nucleotide-binding protein [Eubacteriales bacterium]